METSLNSGLSFIKHVDCGRGVSKEAHKVLIEKTKKIGDFYCWLRKWELCYLESMERQMVAFATEDDFFCKSISLLSGLARSEALSRKYRQHCNCSCKVLFAELSPIFESIKEN